MCVCVLGGVGSGGLKPLAPKYNDNGSTVG